MKRSVAALLIWVVALGPWLVACRLGFQPRDMTGLSITISKPDTQGVDVNLVIENAQREVRRALPDAYLTLFVFSGNCESLSDLRGVIKLVFVQERDSAFRSKPKVFSAFTSVDTVNQIMDLSLRDESGHYPSTDKLNLLEGLSVEAIASIAHKRIAALGLSDCDVTLTSLQDSWSVVCGKLGTFERKCDFEIDSVTG